MPDSFGVTKEIIVNAPVKLVYETASDLKQHPTWNARNRRDSSMSFVFSATTTGHGAFYEWTSDKSDNGTCTIVEAATEKRLVMDVKIKGKGGGTAVWTFESVSEQTKVVRSFDAKIPVPILGPWILLFKDFAKPLAEDFENELMMFKKYIESKVVEK